MATEPSTLRFTIDQYERMVETGVLSEDDRVELIDGLIIEMPPIYPEHSIPVQRLNRIFHRALEEHQAIIRVQDAILLPPRSEPEPDVVLAVPPDTRYLDRQPGPSDLLLVVEVAHTTKRFDSTVKLSLYARSGIEEFWLVDVPARCFEVYRDPGPDGFATMEVIEAGGFVSPQAFPEVHVAIDDVIP